MNNHHHKMPNLEELEVRLLVIKAKIIEHINATTKLLAEYQNMEHQKEQSCIYKK